MKPKINQIKNLDFTNPNYKKLDNGVDLYFFSGGKDDLVCIDFIFKGGSFEEKRPLVSKFTASMINEGTKNYSSKELMDEFNYYGVDVDTKSDPDFSSLSIEVLNKHASKVLPLVKEILINATFPEKELKTQKENYKNHLKVALGKNMYLAKENFLKAIWGENYPYGSSLNFNNIDLVNSEDLREFYQKNYSAENLTIIVSGNIKNDLLDLLNSYFGTKDFEQVSKSVSEDKKFKSNPDKFIQIKGHGRMQSAIAIGFRLFNKKHPDYRLLQIANYILGGGSLGSRLMDNIREKKGYTYGIYAGSSSFLQDGYFRILTEVGNEYREDTLKQIEMEIERMKNEEITEDELTLAKNSLLGDLLELSDGPYNKSGAFQKVILYGLDMSYYSEFEKIIRNTTVKDIQQISQKYYNFDDMYKIVVCND